ncbi:4'-phosphopantetheinyl transferase superfamily protein [Streptomyces sp. SCUT-3]|uniref:4'-phosphopantetheinyl transferase superfamily protein n=1 Tax=Streptomyces sp. SCUT-3 TaxID=2684469 RepID=UPI0031FC4D05
MPAVRGAARPPRGGGTGRGGRRPALLPLPQRGFRPGRPRRGPGRRRPGGGPAPERRRQPGVTAAPAGAAAARRPRPADRPAAFARCWTRKEAYLKGTGTGLGEDPSRTPVGAGPRPEPVPGWLLADVPVPTGHAAAWALRTG